MPNTIPPPRNKKLTDAEEEFNHGKHWCNLVWKLPENKKNILRHYQKCWEACVITSSGSLKRRKIFWEVKTISTRGMWNNPIRQSEKRQIFLEVKQSRREACGITLSGSPSLPPSISAFPVSRRLRSSTNRLYTSFPLTFLYSVVSRNNYLH